MEPVREDEIDLQKIAINLIKFSKKNFRFLLISCFLGVCLSTVIFLFLPKIYASRMVVMSDILIEPYSKGVTENLNNLIKEKNFEALSTRLSISTLEAQSIKYIEIKGTKKTIDEKTKQENTYFNFVCEVGDINVLPKLQDGLIALLRNNEFVKIRVRQRKEMDQTMMEKIGIEIKSLDSLKRRIFAGLPIYPKSAEMLLVEPTNIYSKIIDLTREQLNLKNSLELADGVQLVEGFTIFEKPVSPKLSILLIIGFFGGLFTGIFILTLKKLFKQAEATN